MSYHHMAELLCWNPAQRYGLFSKGDIAVGYDADLALLDPNESFAIRAADAQAQQGYTPFEGMELTGRVKHTFLRGQHIFDLGNITGKPSGRFIKRPH